MGESVDMCLWVKICNAVASKDPPTRTPTHTHLFSRGTTLASRHTAPATTGEATLVPLRLRQPPLMRLPWKQGRHGMLAGWGKPLLQHTQTPVRAATTLSHAHLRSKPRLPARPCRTP